MAFWGHEADIYKDTYSCTASTCEFLGNYSLAEPVIVTHRAPVSEFSNV